MTWLGRQERQRFDFNPDLSGDQWVIGYTPDAAISHGLGSSNMKTDDRQAPVTRPPFEGGN